MTDKPTRPARLPRNGANLAPDGREWVWGPIDKIHEIGDYRIVEYRCDYSNFSQRETWERHGERMFSVFVDGRSGWSFYSLDSALVGAVALKRVGPNSQAAQMFDLMTLGTISEEDVRK